MAIIHKKVCKQVRKASERKIIEIKTYVLNTDIWRLIYLQSCIVYTYKALWHSYKH